MSSAGYSTPGYFTPEDQEALTALKRRQAYANALLTSDTPQGANGGLAAAGSKLLGAFLASRADKQEQDLVSSSQGKYTADLAKLLSGISGPQNTGGGVAAGAPPSPQALGAAMGGPQTPPQGPGQISNNAAVAPTAMPQQSPQQAQNPLQALAASGNPALMQQFGPTFLQNQLAQLREEQVYGRNRADTLHDKAQSVLTPEEVAQRGYRPGTVIERDAFGGEKVVQQSDIMSDDAFKQKARLAEIGKSNMGGYGPNSVFSTIDTANGMYGLSRSGQITPLKGADGQPLVSYHSDVPLRYDMGAAAAGGKNAGSVAEALPTTEASFKVLTDALDAFDRPEVKGQAGNSLGMLDSRLPDIPGYNSNFSSRLKQVAGGTFLQAYNGLRGAGAITENEGAKAEAALNRMQRASTEKDFYEARDDARRTFAEIQNATRQRAGRGAVVPQMGAGGIPEQGAPAQPQVLKFNPTTGKLE